MKLQRKLRDTVFYYVQPGNIIEAKIAGISGIGSDPRCRYRLMTERGHLHEHVFEKCEIFNSRDEVLQAVKPQLRHKSRSQWEKESNEVRRKYYRGE